MSTPITDLNTQPEPFLLTTPFATAPQGWCMHWCNPGGAATGLVTIFRLKRADVSTISKIFEITVRRCRDNDSIPHFNHSAGRAYAGGRVTRTVRT